MDGCCNWEAEVLRPSGVPQPPIYTLNKGHWTDSCGEYTHQSRQMMCSSFRCCIHCRFYDRQILQYSFLTQNTGICYEIKFSDRPVYSAAEVCWYWKFASTDYPCPQGLRPPISHNRKWYSFHILMYVCMYIYLLWKQVQVCNGIKYSRHDKAENQH